MQVQKIQLNQPAFGGDNKYHVVRGDDIAALTEIGGLVDGIKFKELKEGQKPSPLQWLFAATGIGASAFLTAKFGARRAVEALSKLAYKAPEDLQDLGTKWIAKGQKLNSVIDGIQGNNFVTKTYKNALKTLCGKAAKHTDKVKTKLTPAVAEELGANGVAGKAVVRAVSDFIGTAGGVVSGAIAVKAASTDKRDATGERTPDGIADILQSRKKQTKLINGLILQAAESAADIAA